MCHTGIIASAGRCEICKRAIDVRLLDQHFAGESPLANLIFLAKQDGTQQTYQCIILVCQGECDRKLQAKLRGPRKPLSTFSLDSLAGDTLLDQWHCLQELCLKPVFDQVMAEFQARDQSSYYTFSDPFRSRLRDLYRWLRPIVREPETARERDRCRILCS